MRFGTVAAALLLRGLPCRALSVFGRKHSAAHRPPRADAKPPIAAFEHTHNNNNKTTAHPSRYDWVVYVDQSKASLERGGVATLDAFMGLAPEGSRVSVKAAVFSKPPKGKGPFVRCVPLLAGNHSAFEVSNLNSVEKVYRVLTKYMELSGITLQMCDCLKLKYKGNGYLEAKKVSLAIEAYDRALEMHIPSQEGVILFMRAAAHAALAASQRDVLQGMVTQLESMVPSRSTLRGMYALAVKESGLTQALLRKIRRDTQEQDGQLRRIQYWHGLYQHAMIKALEDSLGAVDLLPGYAPAWERAGSILSDLWRLEESLTCYEKAKQLDPASANALEPAFDRIHMRQKLVSDAESMEWAEDPLRLALDLKG